MATAQAAALKDQGNAAYAAQKFTKAYDCYSKAIELDPENHVLYSNRSGVLIDLGRTEEAERDARSCIEKNGQWPKGFLRLGLALEAQQRLEDAAAALSAGAALDPENAELGKAMGRVRSKLGADAAKDSQSTPRPSFDECCNTAAEKVVPSGLPPWTPLETLVARYPAVTLATDLPFGRGLVAARDIPAFSEVFTDPALLWYGVFADRFGAAIPRVCELSPSLRSSPPGSLERALLQLEPFYSAQLQQADERPLPPLTRAELYMRVMRKNSMGACWNDAIPTKEPSRNITMLSTMVSLLNHSCVPNSACTAAWDKSKRTLVVRVSSLRDIKKGEELTITYVPTTAPKATRQAVLLARYGFTCTCSRCAAAGDDTAVFRCPTCSVGRLFLLGAKCEDCGAPALGAASEGGSLLAARVAFYQSEPGVLELSGVQPRDASSGLPPCLQHPSDPSLLQCTAMRLSQCPSLPTKMAVAVADAFSTQLLQQPLMGCNAALWMISVGNVYAIKGDVAKACDAFGAAHIRLVGELGAAHPLTALVAGLAAKPPTAQADLYKAEQRRRELASWVEAYGLPQKTLDRWLSPVAPRGPLVQTPQGPQPMPEDRRAMHLLSILGQRIVSSEYEPGRDLLAVAVGGGASPDDAAAAPVTSAAALEAAAAATPLLVSAAPASPEA